MYSRRRIYQYNEDDSKAFEKMDTHKHEVFLMFIFNLKKKLRRLHCIDKPKQIS